MDFRQSAGFFIMKINIEIQNDLSGVRLDTIVADLSDSRSRSRAAAIVNNHDILVNHMKKKPGYRVKPGDLITGILFDEKKESAVLSENIHLDIIFEDEYILVVNKEPGMVVHPAPGNLTGTLVNALLFHEPTIKNAGDPLRSGIVHRLDKETSGLMVVAKTKHSLDFLQKEFKFRRVEKKYLALVSGNLLDDQGEINLPIGRHPVKRKIMAINHEKGKSAITLWKVIKKFKTASLVEAILKTGRTHQIRVHFYAIDSPLIGDPVYQPKRFRKQKNVVHRQMLHSWQLSFRHPYSGQKVNFKAPLPKDFLETRAALESI